MTRDATDPAPQHYAPYYCEENIWHLCGRPELSSRESYAMVISNPDRACAVWQQRAARKPAEPVVWDYHVVLLARAGKVWKVWDFDTLLGFPCLASRWCSHSFLPLPASYAHLEPRFRLIASSEYRAKFSSDRGHMCEPDGTFRYPPPSWPAIVVPDAPSFLRWTEMESDETDCLTLAQLTRLVSLPAPLER